MKTVFNTLLIAFSAVTLLVACAGDRQAARNAQEKLGTGDSGGGNVYKGRPIDSYIVDIRQNPAYKKRIEPILSGLFSNRFSETVPRESMSNQDLGRMLTYIVTKKTWYFIPGELEILPKDRTGLVVGTEQGALQGHKEIWFNAELFSTMTEDDQATLILHEILMGMRILKFESSYIQCLSYSPKLEYCDNNSKIPQGSMNQLTTTDYADIRSTVAEILSGYENFTYSDWEDLMARKGFSLSSHDFRLKADQGEIRKDEFIRSLQTATIAKKLPIYGYPSGARNKPVVKSTESCKIEFENLEAGAVVNIKTTLGNKLKTFSIDLTDKEKIAYSKYVDFNQLKLSYIRFDESGETPKAGDRYMTLNFIFDLNEFVGLELREMIWTRADKDSSAAETPGDAFFYQCLKEPVLNF